MSFSGSGTWDRGRARVRPTVPSAAAPETTVVVRGASSVVPAVTVDLRLVVVEEEEEVVVPPATGLMWGASSSPRLRGVSGWKVVAM
jgi:hypothetical protein